MENPQWLEDNILNKQAFFFATQQLFVNVDINLFSLTSLTNKQMKKLLSFYP